MQTAISSINVLDPTSEIARFEDKVRREEALALGQAEIAASSPRLAVRRARGVDRADRDRGPARRAQGRRRAARSSAPTPVTPEIEALTPTRPAPCVAARAGRLSAVAVSAETGVPDAVARTCAGDGPRARDRVGGAPRPRRVGVGGQHGVGVDVVVRCRPRPRSVSGPASGWNCTPHAEPDPERLVRVHGRRRQPHRAARQVDDGVRVHARLRGAVPVVGQGRDARRRRRHRWPRGASARR